MSKLNNLSVPSIIRKKRDKEELDDTEIRFVIESIITDDPEEKIHDAQIGNHSYNNE